MTRGPSFERRLRSELRSARPPRAADAERRAWHVVSAAHAAHAPAAPRRRALRLALAVAAALTAATLALTPAGARVGDWIDDVVSPTPTPRASLALPAPGRLLVVGRRLGLGGRRGRRPAPARRVRRRDLVARRPVRGGRQRARAGRASSLTAPSTGCGPHPVA